MKMNKFAISLVLLIYPILSFAQVNLSPFISSGYMSHLSRNGINTELGVDVEYLKRLNISTALRYSSLDSNTDNRVNIKAISSFISYTLVNNEKHKLSIGPGVSYGNYERYSDLVGFEKDYNGFWFNPVKIRYDYSLKNKFKIGIDASLYGDDGDGSTFIGLVLGYKL